MRERWLVVANLMLLLGSSLLLSALQSSFWFQLFGALPPPHLWIPLAVYLSLCRRPIEGIFTLYTISFIWMNLTVVPLGTFLFFVLGIHLAVQAIKQRVYWPGSTYFMIISGGAALLLPPYQLLLSLVFETQVLRGPDYISWILQALLTALFSLPIYPLLNWIDRITHKEQPAETGTHVL